jgi:regulator of cell morphogenesis and NO signaling
MTTATTDLPALDSSSSARTWDAQEPAHIIAFILERFHEPLRRGLPALVAAARAVEGQHRSHRLCPVGLADHLEQVLIAVESHLAKEEKILFPLIVAGRGGMALMPIKVMMAEHEDHGVSLSRTRALTHDFALPDPADASWRDLYLRLQALEADLEQHIALENDVLFPRAMGSEPAHR